MTIDQELEYLKLEVQKLKADRARMAKALQENSRHGREFRKLMTMPSLAMWRQRDYSFETLCKAS